MENFETKVALKKELLDLQKKMKRIDNQILKISDDEKVLLKKKEKKELKAKEKELLEKYNSELEIEADDFKNKDISYFKTLAYNGQGYLSARGDHDIGKFIYYFSGIDFDYEEHMIYYFLISYYCYLAISKKKRINRYISFSDDSIIAALINVDVCEFYLKKNGMSKFISYMKRLLSK